MTNQSNELLWLKYKLGRWRVVISLNLSKTFDTCLPWQHHNKQIDEVMDWINGQRWPGNCLDCQAQISKGKTLQFNSQFLEVLNGSYHLNITTPVSLTNKNIFLTKSCCCSCPVCTISYKIWMGMQGRGQCQKHSQTKLRLFHWKGWPIHRFPVKV